MHLRIEKDCPVPLKKLKGLLKKTILKVESISSDPSLSYKKRIEAAFNAFQFACETIALQVQEPQRYTGLVQQAKNLCKYYTNLLRKKNLLANQEILLRYLKHLEYLLAKQPPRDLAATSPAKWLAKADEYAVLIQPKPILATLAKLQGVKDEQYLLQVERPQNPVSSAVLQQYLDTQNPDKKKHPVWYILMEPFEKLLLDKALQEVLAKDSYIAPLERLRCHIQAISSRLRRIPGLPNFSVHEGFIVDKEGKVLTVLPADLRSSVVSSRDYQESFFNSGTEKLGLRRAFTKDNIALIIENFVEDYFLRTNQLPRDAAINQLLEETPILLQTLISPQAPAAMKPDAHLFADKNYVITQLKEEGLNLHCCGRKVFVPGKNLNLFYTNHPLNPARHLAQTVSNREIGSSTTTPPSMDALITFAKTHLLANDPNNALIKAVYTALEREKAAPYSSTYASYSDMDNHRELYLASLELLLVALMKGIAHSTCVSGKDRRAILAMFKEAIAVYIFNYAHANVHHGFFEAMLKDPRFQGIFISIYKSGHHQANAAQNAPGAEGIKTPQLYMPNHFAKAIGSLRLKQDHRLAGNNEFDHLLAEAPYSPHRHILRGSGLGFVAGIFFAGAVIAVVVLLSYLSVISVGLIPLISMLAMGGLALGFGWGFIGGFVGHELEVIHLKEHWQAIDDLALLEEKNTLFTDALEKTSRTAEEAFGEWVESKYQVILVDNNGNFAEMLTTLQHHQFSLKKLKKAVEDCNEMHKEAWLTLIQDHIDAKEKALREAVDEVQDQSLQRVGQ